MREDINAYDAAHGMWALRYELSGRNYSSIIPTSAQERHLVDWKEVEKSLGVSNRYRQYVISVLKLTPDALRLIQQHGLSESTIRPITQKLHKHADLQMQALRQLIAWQESEDKHSLVREVKSLVDELVSQIPKKSETPRPNLLPVDNKETKKRPKTSPATTQTQTTAQEVTPPGRADGLRAPARISEPILDLSCGEAPTQSTLGSQNQTLRRPFLAPEGAKKGPVRPARQTDQRSYWRRVTEALDQINPNDPDHLKDLLDMKEELQTLKSKIDHLLSYI